MHHTRRVLYRERLLPGATFLLLGLGLFLMVGIAYSAAFGSLVGIFLAVITSALYIILAVITAPQIGVAAEAGDVFLTAGRAKINVSIVRTARELTVEERQEVARGTRNDTAFHLIKGKLPVVELAISDPLDPHRNWCLSSRTPEKLMHAILSAQGPNIPES
jgi:hypothetical protein